MKFFLSIPFGFLLLVQTIGVNIDLCCELQKLPVLFEHYEEHSQYDDATFTEFLNFHYGSGEDAEEHHHDDEHDSKLPFHGQHHCSHGQIFMVTFFNTTDFIKQDFVIQKGTAHYNFSITSEYLDTLFQPPRA